MYILPVDNSAIYIYILYIYVIHIQIIYIYILLLNYIHHGNYTVYNPFTSICITHCKFSWQISLPHSKRLQTLDATHLSSGQVGLDADGFLGPAQRCSRCQLAGVWLDKKWQSVVCLLISTLCNIQ